MRGKFRMNVMKVKDFDELSDRACEIIVKRLKEIKDPVLGLATGSTPAGLYTRLIKKYRENKLSFEDVTTFNLDEYIGLEKDHPSSYHYYMEKMLFRHVDLSPDRTFLPNGLAPDLEKECQRFERLIQTENNIDVQLLGMGVNGHIGFNEPGTPFHSRTDVVQLTESTIQVNGRFFESKEEVPETAITMGLQTIMDSKEIILLVSGSHKAAALKGAIYGEVTEDLPASVLQLHDNITIIADEAAFRNM